MNNIEEIKGYFWGVLLGDGHINYTEKAINDREYGRGKAAPHIILKACDYEFVERWRNCITALTGKERKISPLIQKVEKHRTQYLARCSSAVFVDECEEKTKHKTKIPEEVFSFGLEGKKAFITGVMDSEGWVNMAMSSLKMNDLTLGFGCGDLWFFDFIKLLHELGIKTSKIYTRPAKPKKNGEMGKNFHLVRLDIHDYINAGLSFTIKRKADRLAFCSRILRDYMLNYPRYADYYALDGIVQSSKKLEVA